jgi:hypothetical protein
VGLKIALLFAVFSLQITANEYYSLKVGNSRTYKEYSTYLPNVFGYIQDTLVARQVFKGIDVYTNHNIVKIDSIHAKIKSTPVSYWYERNDTVFAVDNLDSVGTSVEEAVQTPIAVPSIDSAQESVNDTMRNVFYIWDSLPRLTIELGTFTQCIRTTISYRNSIGVQETLSVGILAKYIGFIYGETYEYDTPPMEIVAYTIDGVSKSLNVRPGDTPALSALNHCDKWPDKCNILGQEIIGLKAKWYSGVFILNGQHKIFIRK